jgi:hypothetical protein
MADATLPGVVPLPNIDWQAVAPLDEIWLCRLHALLTETRIEVRDLNGRLDAIGIRLGTLS